MLCGRRARVRYDNSHRDRPPRRGQPRCMNHGRLSVLMRMVLRRSVVFSTARECGRFRGWRAVSRLGLQVEHRRLRRTTKAAFRDIFPSLAPPCAGSCTFNGHRISVESEAAHWGLFLINFTLHVLDTYGAPDKWAQSAQARSVAAFLFGLRSHQVRARAVCRARTCESAAHAAACTHDRAVNGCSGGRRSVALGP